MGTITVTTFGADPQTVNSANLNALVTPIITECNGKLDNTNIVAAAGIVDTKLATISTAGKVLGAALNTLTGIPSGAGVIPVANLGSGTPTALTALLGDGSWGTPVSPTGSITMWGGAIASPPAGWLVCDGSAVSQTTYAALYAVIGTIYGSDDGGNFTLPNFSRKFAYGADEGSDAGDASVGSAGGLTPAANDNLVTAATGAPSATNDFALTGAGGATNIHTHNAMPPYLAVAYIIKT
jgi:microcystin-dependent protein